MLPLREDKAPQHPIEMVISFTVDEAFSQLRRHGFVFTFRWKQRENPYGETWVNRGRGEEKEFDAWVAEIGRMKPFLGNLSVFHLASGFPSTKAWKEEIMEMRPDENTEYGYIYLVSRPYVHPGGHHVE